MTARRLAAVLGFLGVALGAFGAHGLSKHLAAGDPEFAVKAMDWWRTAVLYHLVHAVALLALAGRDPDARPGAAGWAFTAGILLFSGSLYAMALGVPGSVMGPVTPTGGHCWFMGGEADGVEGVKRAVRERKKAGVDWIKVMASGGNMTPGTNPFRAQQVATALTALVDEPWWSDAFTAYARTARITRNLDEAYALNPDAYELPVEEALHTAYESAAAQMAAADQPEAALGAVISQLADPINEFFENVLVNAEDETVRQARLGLAQHIADLPANMADLSRLQGF